MKSLRNALLSFALIAAAAVLCSATGRSIACTDARIIAKDGSVVTGRTMEFGIDMHSRLIVQPRGAQLTSPGPNGKPGLKWDVKYGFVALDAFTSAAGIDGLNEAGLGIGGLYLPNLGKYADVPAGRSEYALSNLQFCNWALSRFATVDELRKELPTVSVWGEPVPELGHAPAPVHFVVHDASGKSIVLEWIDGTLNIYDNTVGVMTNCPAYDWHLTNLRNFANLSPVDAVSKTVDGQSIQPLGEGSGLVGLPGDPTPPSRFVATALAVRFAAPSSDAAEALVMVQKIINRVDIPHGLVRVSSEENAAGDYTQWAVFRDHANRVLYWRTYGDMTLRAVDLKQLDFTAGTPRRALDLGQNAATVEFVKDASIPTDTKSVPINPLPVSSAQ